MKNSFLFSVSLFVFLMVSCNSKSVTIYQKNEVKDFSTLEVRLQRTPGVFFQNGQVRIRGNANSFNSNSEPLFEINGQVIAGGYNQAKSMVSPMDIKSIRVLKNPDELAMYGTRGMNGVIKIKMRNTKGEDGK